MGRLNYENVDFGTFIYRVLRQVHPESGMSGDGLSSLNNLIRVVLRKIMENVNRLMVSGKRKTISSREIQSAVRLSLPGELAKHAVNEGTKAVTKYNSSEGPLLHGEGGKAKPVSRSKRAGLQFPVTRVENIMMQLATAERKSGGSAVYLAGVLEYICAEILELGGNAARDNKKVRITPRHIKLAILNDEELATLFRGVVMSGGVVPFIHTQLIKQKPEKKEAKPRRLIKKPTLKKTPKSPQKEKSPQRKSSTKKRK